jgi:hypothetical protein
MNSARVDYIVVHKAEIKLQDFLEQKLKGALESNYIELSDNESLSSIVTIRYTKPFSTDTEKSLSGVSVDLTRFDNGEESIPAIVADFSDLVSEDENDSAVHVVKLYDHNLHLENAQLAQEIFEIEMKLREVFSVIFIDTLEDDFYNLLVDVNAAPMDSPQVSQMQKRYENQFFYLTFSQYKNLNEKKPIGGVPQIIQLLRTTSNFQEFQEYFTYPPVRKEEYADFILSLKANLDPIEKVRNCVMHNRSISEDDKGNYDQAKEKLMKLADEFLASLQEK